MTEDSDFERFSGVSVRGLADHNSGILFCMFEIVVVCTGNRNRSPIAEAALKQAAQGLPVQVSSVGLLDLRCAPALPETLEVAARIGLDLESHRSRSITTVELSEVDLLLGLEWEHVAAAVVDHGAPKKRSFTLLELAGLLTDLPETAEPDIEARARALVRDAHDKKRASTSSRLGLPVRDPFGGPMSGYEEMAQLVKEAAENVAGKLFGAAGTQSR